MHSVLRWGSIASPTLACNERLHNLAELIDKARQANRRLLDIQRGSQGCAIETALWERFSQSSLEGGRRTGPIRFGDKRVSVPSQCALRGANYRCRPQRQEPSCLGVLSHLMVPMAPRR